MDHQSSTRRARKVLTIACLCKDRGLREGRERRAQIVDVGLMSSRSRATHAVVLDLWVDVEALYRGIYSAECRQREWCLWVTLAASTAVMQAVRGVSRALTWFTFITRRNVATWGRYLQLNPRHFHILTVHNRFALPSTSAVKMTRKGLQLSASRTR